ncbi:MAG: thioredoxin domain-containing protein [Candidatus Falkowbacteria bacterium]
MWFHKKKDQKKENRKFIAAVVILILLMAVLYAALVLNGRQAAPSSQLPDVPAIPDDAAIITEANRQAIKDAERAEFFKIRPIDSTDHIQGEEGAPVEIIVYSDFECEFCANFSDTLKKAEEEYGEKLVVAYRHYPLRLNPNSEAAAIASECAAEQGKFWEMHDKLFMDNKNNNMGPDQFKQDAAAIQLDRVKFNQCLDMEKYKDKIWAQFAEGKDAGVAGTPNSFINGEPVPGDVPFEDFTDSAGVGRKGMKSIIERHLL